MSYVMENIFKSLDIMIENCQRDYELLKCVKIDETFFEDFNNQRIINSFLFSYTKIQDKIGAKLFRRFLYEQKEIEEMDMPMKDILNLLEKLGFLESVQVWDRLREIRNNLAHEYPFDIQERIENIEMALEGFEILKDIYTQLRKS